MTPEILVSQASTSIIEVTIKNEDDNANPNLLTARPARTHNNDRLAFKPNHFRAKSARYNSHKYFLSRCIQEKLVPKGLELNLEPKIGNYDREPTNNWYSNLNDLSLILMKQIVTYRKKTQTENPNKYYRNRSNFKETTKDRQLSRNTKHYHS